MLISPLALMALFSIVFGLVIGSFLTVCIYRLPFKSLAEEERLLAEAKEAAQGEVTYFDDLSPPLSKAPVSDVSIVNPRRSFCPSCLAPLRWWHNIPLFSWLALGGKCSKCAAPISARYPLVEIITALTALLSFSLYGITPTGFVVFFFCAALIVLSVIDYDYYIIPNAISIPGTLLAVVIAGVNHFFHIFTPPVVQNMLFCLYGVLSGAGFLLIISEFYLRVRKIEGLGMGDVKLLAMTGALFGPECSIYTIFVGSLLGAFTGVALIMAQGKKMSHPLPFGPYLAVATIIYLFGGPTIAQDTANLIGRTVTWSW